MESACAFTQGQACRRPSSVSLLCVGLNEAWGKDAPAEAPAPLPPASPHFTASFHLGLGPEEGGTHSLWLRSEGAGGLLSELP